MAFKSEEVADGTKVHDEQRTNTSGEIVLTKMEGDNR